LNAMIVDAFKIVIWIIEYYGLQNQVLDHLDHPLDKKEEAVMVTPRKPYLMHFDDRFVTKTGLQNKVLQCTEDAE